jgi:hypothetical protein
MRVSVLRDLGDVGRRPVGAQAAAFRSSERTEDGGAYYSADLPAQHCRSSNVSTPVRLLAIGRLRSKLIDEHCRGLGRQ